MKKILFLVVSLLLCLNNQTTAQVTIGSSNVPVSGALLDLKEKLPGTDNMTSTKGLGLPRVYLTNLQPSTPQELAESIGNMGAWDMDEHIGLTVYNTNNMCISTGVFVWTGTEWLSLFDNDGSVSDLSGFQADVNALKEFYDANTLKTFTWDFDSDPMQFEGVIWSKECRVTGLIFNTNKLINADTGISKLEMLDTLIIVNNRLPSLDVTQNPNLKYLDVDGNRITTIDVTQNPNLEILSCNNQTGKIKSLDISQNPNLVRLNCSDNDIQPKLDLTNNPNFRYLECNNNPYLTEIDLSNCPRIYDVSCSTNRRLTTLKLPSNPSELFALYCNGSGFTSLDLSACMALNTINCNDQYDGLTTLVLPNTSTLAKLECANNKLTSLDISPYSGLSSLNCALNYMTQATVNNLKATQPNFCNITNVFRQVTPQYVPNTIVETTFAAPTCP